MKIRVEDIQLGEFKDTADFKKLKQECYTAASKGAPIDFSELPPAEYKYFSEMYWIYSDFAGKRIAENAAKEREQKAYKEYCENVNDQTTYLQNIAYKGEAIVDFTRLVPDTEYIVYCYHINLSNGQATDWEVYTETIRTAATETIDENITMSFEVHGAHITQTVTTENPETYYYTECWSMNDFKAYFMKNNQPVYENPSPGNKAGGISTLEEKSLGCTQKSGNSIVRDVLAYGERLTTKGLNLLSAPGNDLVASTALAAAGCQIVLFTTGRGTPFGTFVPTAKISTNSTLAANKPLWIDFNAGTIVEDSRAEDVDKEFIDFVLGVASGNLVNNEKSGYSEIAIFKSGVTL